ncbi:MAG: hypothetical protein AB7L66_08435 [Gemmatimonadales bacterium]
MTAAPCSAQLVVQGVRDLDFGPVLQGVDQSVSPTDPVRSGQFYFSTPGIGTRIRIRLTLPSRLNGPGGAQMRIRFGPNDAMAQGTGPTSLPAFFNPNSNVNYTMVTSADANIWLGGTVQPAANQPVGTYTNTVVLTVTVF